LHHSCFLCVQYSFAINISPIGEPLELTADEQFIINEIGQFDDSGKPYGVFVKNNFAFFACGTFRLRRIIDITFKLSPNKMG